MGRLSVTMVMLMVNVAVYAQFRLPHIQTIAQAEKRGYEHRLDPPGGYTSASDNFKVSYYRLCWNIDPAVRYISGAVTSYFTMTTAGTQLVYDLDNNLVADSIHFRNSSVSFLQGANKTLTIDLGLLLEAGSLDSLTIYYRGTPPDDGLGSFTQTTHNGNVPVLWTLSEPYGARDWWPC